jgi:type IV pilus assembly protein PilE
MMGNNSRGFTLIELMITVAIIAIIAAVAFPSYQDSVRKTRRADGKAALERAAALQERWFTENNSYAPAVGNIGGNTSDDGHYTIGLDVTCAGVAPTYIGCFDLTATAVGPQASDAACTTFTLDETGARGYTGTGSTADCWQ